MRRSARLALRLAAVGEGDDDAVPRADEARELVLGLGEPARGDRGPLRLERVRLAPRERIELGRAVELERREALLLPDAAHLVRLPDEVGRPVDRRHEVVGPRRPLVVVGGASTSARSLRRSAAG